jgi:hypothetical protein
MNNEANINTEVIDLTTEIMDFSEMVTEVVDLGIMVQEPMDDSELIAFLTDVMDGRR